MTDTNVASEAETAFLKREPAVSAALALAVVQYVVRALLTHGVIGASVASSLTQQLDPLVTGVLIVVAGFVLRHFVSPAATFAARVVAEVEKRLTTAAAQGVRDSGNTTVSLDGAAIDKLSGVLRSAVADIKVDGKSILTAIKGKPDDPPATSVPVSPTVPVITSGGASELNATTGQILTLNADSAPAVPAVPSVPEPSGQPSP